MAGPTYAQIEYNHDLHGFHHSNNKDYDQLSESVGIMIFLIFIFYVFYKPFLLSKFSLSLKFMKFMQFSPTG